MGGEKITKRVWFVRESNIQKVYNNQFGENTNDWINIFS